MNNRFLIFFLVVFNLGITQTFGQAQTVTGTILEAETGLAVAGANVTIKGSSRGTISNVDGFYTIEASPGDTLVFSFIGMQHQERAVGNLSVIDISLGMSSIGIEEVIAIGYGRQRKSDVTGSVSSFDTDIIKERPSTNIVQALQGSMAGVTITTGGSTAEGIASVLIRGENSITASNAPLIILDGIPYDGSLSELNPNDIESMEVLKDASSTAIYGSRGANGVILIGTKQGKEGTMQVSYNMFYTWDEVANMPDMQNATDYWRDMWERNMTNPLSHPGNSTTLEQQFNNALQGDETDNTEINAFMQGYPGQSWTEYRDGILANYPGEVHDRETLLQLAEDFAYPAGGRDTDWVGLASRTGHKQQHNLSLSGGSEKMTYYISGIYDKSEGIALGDDFERMVSRINLNIDLFKGVRYGTNSQIGFYDRSGIPTSWGMGNSGAFYLSPLYIPYNEDGSLNLYPIPEDSNVENPLEPLLFENDNKETRIISNHYLDVDIPWVKGLHYKLNFGYRWSQADNKTYKGLNTIEGGVDKGNLTLSNNKGYAWTLENILSYQREFGMHNIFLTGLYSSQEQEDTYQSTNGRGFDSDIMSLYQMSTADIVTGESAYRKKSYISQMLRAHYGFDNRYMITATVRRDGFSAFGNDTKFGVFPSVALGWNLANEGFMAGADFLGSLKLRLSYGENGNEAISPYSTLPRLSTSEYIDENGNVLFGYFPSQLANPTLGWETTKSFNLGLDYSMFNGRLRGTIDAYTSSTYDLLLKETISAINGTTSIIRNVGETANRGIEFQLSSINIVKGDFTWSTDFNWTIYQSKIVNVGLKDEEGNYIDDVASEWFIGYPVDVNFDYVLDRILQKEDFMVDANGDYLLDDNNNYQLLPEVAEEIVLTTSTPRPGQPILKDLNGDGTISGAADKDIHGDLNPDFLAGMTNSLRYKNWTLSIFLNGVWGVNKQNNLINNRALGPKRKLNLTYWTPENPTNELPGLNASGFYPGFNYYPYFDVNYLRIQDISLSYKLPHKLLNRIFIDNLEIFANIKNLYTFTNWEGLDPEFNSGDNDTATDVPRAKSYIIGCRLAF